jgi:hypothetical protein
MTKRTKDEIEGALYAAAGSASTPADIAVALAGLETGEAEQVDPNRLAAFCHAKDIDPEAPEIVNYIKKSREYRERKEREAADVKALAKTQAIAADAGHLADFLSQKGASATQAQGKSKDEIEATIQRIYTNSAALVDKDAETDNGTWADFINDCKTYDPNKDFRPSLLAGLSFPDGTLSYIGARTGRGKTTIMLNIAREALSKDPPPRKVVFITLEESRKQLLRKLILSTAYSMGTTDEKALLDTRAEPDRADGRSVKSDFYTVMRGENGLSGEGAGEAYRLITAAQEHIAGLYGKSLIVKEAQGVGTLERVEAVIAEYAEPGSIVLVDYVQRLPAPDGFRATDFMLGKAQSNGLFVTAKKTGAVILSGAQFKRPTGTATDKYIKLDGVEYDDFDETSFRESGDIEQDAHNALGIGKGKDPEDDKKRYIKVMKTREDVAGGTCYSMDFQGAYAYMTIGERLTITKAKGKQSGAKGKKDKNGDPDWTDPANWPK